jgi:hypothetical protein
MLPMCNITPTRQTLSKNIAIYLRKVVLKLKAVAQRRKVAVALYGTHSFITLFTGADKSTQPPAQQIRPKSATIFNEYIRFNIAPLSAACLDLRRTLLSSDCAHFNPICATGTLSGLQNCNNKSNRNPSCAIVGGRATNHLNRRTDGHSLIP